MNSVSEEKMAFQLFIGCLETFRLKLEQNYAKCLIRSWQHPYSLSNHTISRVPLLPSQNILVAQAVV
jgi:hypothetical protein